jgi:WD40 repeat protein
MTNLEESFPQKLSRRSIVKGLAGLAWSPDGGRLASGSADQTVQIFQVVH